MGLEPRLPKFKHMFYPSYHRVACWSTVFWPQPRGKMRWKQDGRAEWTRVIITRGASEPQRGNSKLSWGSQVLQSSSPKKDICCWCLGRMGELGHMDPMWLSQLTFPRNSPWSWDMFTQQSEKTQVSTHPPLPTYLQRRWRQRNLFSFLISFLFLFLRSCPFKF